VREWPEPVERVAHALRAAAVDARLEELPTGTPTAQAAARALGCAPGEIVKTLVFVCDREYVLALLPGDRRADAQRVAAAAGATRARIAAPDEVLDATGFEPGAVAPFPAARASRVLLDRPLLARERLWAGGGSDRHMVGLAPDDLIRVAQAAVADLS